MQAYILRRLLLIIPTLFGVMLINFALTQFVPGGPIEYILAKQNNNGDVLRNITTNSDAGQENALSLSEDAPLLRYEGARGLPEEFIQELEAEFGFDKPVWQRFFEMLGKYLRFDFGESYFRSIDVVDLIIEKLPVSITLGLWSTLIAYLISIPLGIRKALRDGSPFDRWTSGVIIAAYSIPAFLFAILLLVLFVGGSYWKIFPLRGLTSENFSELTFFAKVIDYMWHITLPVIVTSISGFATLTLLTKNSFLEEIRKQYVITARAKGASERRILYGHVFRNAMLIIISGFPALFISVLFGASLIIETLFSLDGLGRLGFEAALQRDYPVIFGTLYVFGLIALTLNIISDLVYVWIDPRIDFEGQGKRL